MDPFGSLISITTLREHEIGKLRKKINELKNRLTNIKLDIEQEKRRELEILNEVSDNLRKESELRSRIASLNASIELADKLRNDHMKRVEKEKSELEEMKRRHDAILAEKRDLWAVYEVIYESLDGAKELKKEKGVLKLLHFALMKETAELQQLVKEHALLDDIQESIIFKLSSKIEDADRGNTELASQIEAQEKKNTFKREENEKLKDELEKLKSQHLPFNLISRVTESALSSSRVTMERESVAQPIAKKLCAENVIQRKDSNNYSGSQIPASNQAELGFKSILTRPFQQIKNFSSSLFSFANLGNITSVRPRKRIEEVDEATQKLMLQLEENKRAIIERQSELSQLSNESQTHASLSKSNSNRELNRNWDEVNSNISQDKQVEKSSNVCSQAPSQKNNSEVDAQKELMPPPALVAPQMNDTNYFSQSQSDHGYQTQTQSTFVESQDEYRQRIAHTMYPLQTSQASGMDYRRDNRQPLNNLPTGENNNRFQFKVESEPMEQSQPDQPSELTYNANQASTLKYSREKQLSFPLNHEEAVVQKSNADHNNAAFHQQKVPSMEQEMVGSSYDNGEGNDVVESEYFSSKKYGQMKTLNRRSLENMNSFEQMDTEMQHEHRVQSPDMSFMMSPICSPMPDGLISPPPPPSSDTINNMGGFGFQMKSQENRNVGFSFDSNKPATSSGGAIFKMF